LCENLKNELNSKLSRLTEVNQKAILEHNKSKSEEENYLQLNNKLVFIENELARFYKEKSNFQGSLSEVERDYYKTREKLAEQEEKSKSIIRNSNLMQVEINKMKEEFSEVKYEITAVGDRLNIEFGVPINDIINSKPNNEIDIEVEQEKITALKIKIQNFGEINPLALEAYDEIRVRYDVIIQQRADIQAAKISLMKTISEIESTATKQFMNSFESIRLNFIEVFRSLFTDDDTCDLILLDETNPLDSHIEILAKPKGKKPKSLSQLSGGEKTLTATALLFALYLLKPAPFCIFDEVDAPLDDANIMKFNKIINKFSDRSQFIIITHNKATMASVDTLYGVYMQEVGISAVTPVDFRKYQDTGLFETIEQN
jgi:chromosome segregation protein